MTYIPETFIDGASGREFQSTRQLIAVTVHSLNERIKAGKVVLLNDIWAMFGLHVLSFGNRHGWRLPNLTEFECVPSISEYQVPITYVTFKNSVDV